MNLVDQGAISYISQTMPSTSTSPPIAYPMLIDPMSSASIRAQLSIPSASTASSSSNLVPTSLSARQRKASRSDRPEESVAAPLLLSEPLVSERTRSLQEQMNELQKRRVSSPNEQDEWVVRKELDSRIKTEKEKERLMKGLDSKGKGRAFEHDDHTQAPGSSLVPGLEEPLGDNDSDSDPEMDHCVICLQKVDDPTVVGECGHRIFCVSSSSHHSVKRCRSKHGQKVGGEYRAIYYRVRWSIQLFSTPSLSCGLPYVSHIINSEADFFAAVSSAALRSGQTNLVNVPCVQPR
jgi:hypothetical protein